MNTIAPKHHNSTRPGSMRTKEGRALDINVIITREIRRNRRRNFDLPMITNL